MIEDLEFEREVLSGMISTADNMHIAKGAGVKGDCFFDSENGEIFEEVSELAESSEWEYGEVVTILINKGVIGKHESLQSICAILPEWLFSPENVLLNAQSLVRRHIGRLVSRAATSANSRVLTGDDPEEVLAGISRDIESIQNRGTISVRDKSTIINETIDLERRISSGEQICLPFPWFSFNVRTGGIPLGTYTPFLGRDGKGKSRAATWLTAQWIMEGRPILYFPYEDGENRFFRNLAASLGEYDAFTIRKEPQTIPKGFIDNHCNILEKLKELPIYIDTDSRDNESVSASIYKHKRKYGIQGAIIDGIKDMSAKGRQENQTASENEITKSITRTAGRTNVAVIGISHPRDIPEEVWIERNAVRGSKVQNMSARMNLIFQDSGWPEWVRSRYGSVLDEEDVCAVTAPKASYGDSGIVVLRKELHKGRFVEVTPMEMR